MPEAKKPARSDLQRAVDELVAPKTAAEPIKPAKPARNIATKNRKRAALVIGEAKVAARTGKRQLNVTLDQDLVTRVKIRATQSGETIEEWVAAALIAKLGGEA